MIEIIIAIIFIGMISEVVMGIGQIKKSNALANININTHILLDSEIEQTKGNCYLLDLSTCSSRGGVATGSNLLAINDTCTFNYSLNGIDGVKNDITSTCTKASNGFFNINVSLTRNGLVLKGDGFVTSTNF